MISLPSRTSITSADQTIRTVCPKFITRQVMNWLCRPAPAPEEPFALPHQKVYA